MDEFKLKIKEENNFIIVMPQTLALLISKIYYSLNPNFTICVDEILPEDLVRYVVNVINGNRFTNKRFYFKEFSLKHPITKREYYQLVLEQLKQMEMEQTFCFEEILLSISVRDGYKFEIECEEHFFRACKDINAKFVFSYPDDRQKVLRIDRYT